MGRASQSIQPPEAEGFAVVRIMRSFRQATNCFCHVVQTVIDTPNYSCYMPCCAARYDKFLLGVFPVGDLTEVVAAAGADAVILEEPEHLTWYHHGPRWTERFDHVARPPSQTPLC